MILEYAYCSHCGSEFIDTFLPYICTYANGNSYRCLDCDEEIIISESSQEEDKVIL